MNNKGFTLIELILVIAIIALLSLVFTPNILNLMNKNNTNAYNSIITSVESAAKNYVTNNKYDTTITSKINCSNETNIIEVDLQTLVNAGDLSSIPKNPCSNTNLDFNPTDIVEVTFDCNTKTFSYKFREEITNNKCNNRD